MPTKDEAGREHGTLKDKHSIFESVYQRVDHIDPRRIKLSRDRVLIEDIPDADKVGSIWVPDSAKGMEQIRQGKVVAVGPGDTGIETAEAHGTDSDGRPRTRIRRAVCPMCEDKHARWRCPKCNGTGAGHLPMSVRPGDRVLYQRREESEITIEGRLYDLVFEEQSVLALMLRDGDFIVSLRQVFGGIADPVTGRIDRYGTTVPLPLRDRILVSRDAKAQKSTGGLFIPASSSEERPEGVVVAVGSGKLRIDGTWEGLEVKPGDHVVFRDGAGREIKIKGERFLVMREDEVLGVLE